MHEQLKEKLVGCVYSVFTPFGEDERVDFEALERYLAHMYRTGARKFYVMAYNSRYAQLTNDEIMELNAFVTRTVKGYDRNNIAIVGDPIHCTTKVSTEFARHAREIGADLVSLLLQEKHYSDEQYLDHFAEVGRDAKFPVLVHEMAMMSGFNGVQMHWPVSLLNGLLKIPEVAALKEDAKVFETTRAALALEPQIRVIISGAKAALLKYKPYGVRAYLNGVSMFDARIGERFWAAFESGDEATVDFIVKELEAPLFGTSMGKYGWHRINKAFLQAAGFFHRRDLMPLKTISDAEFEDIQADYRKIKSALDRFLAR
jgi:4-hydroxy-tetrahydrodipicolinate synthase